MSDTVLARNIFEELYDKNFNALFMCAYSIVLDAEDAKEITEQVLEDFYKKNEKYKSKEEGRFFLIRTVKNFSINNLKHKIKEKKLSCKDRESMTEKERLLYFVNSSLISTLDVLEVYVLFKFSKLSLEEIASSLLLPIGNVKNKLYRARVMLFQNSENLQL